MIIADVYKKLSYGQFTYKLLTDLLHFQFSDLDNMLFYSALGFFEI